MHIGDRVSGTMQGQQYTGVVTNVHYRGGHVSLDGTYTDGAITVVRVRTDRPLTTPSGRQVHTALVRGAAEVAALVRMPNCVIWPHNPPHCGCPVEVAP